MSDERFDQDLRSVLQEDAPRDVPDELRRKVADIPSAYPAGRGRPSWRQPVPLWIGGLVAAALVIAIGVWRLGPLLSTDVGASPTPLQTVGPSATAPSVATASPSNPPSASPSVAPSLSPSSSPAVVACVAADLEARILGWQGAAGSRIADVEIDNTSARPCWVRGTPGLQLVDAHDIVLLDSATAGPSGRAHVSPSDPSFELAPGGHLRTQVQASNYCGPDATLPIHIDFDLPAGGGKVKAVPASGVSSDEAVPPCMGSTAGTIAMNGWRR
jgi:uncharacterized protein DUF4232